jgi:exonuclease III
MPTLTTKIIGNNNYFSLISLNINGLNSPIKRYRLTDWLHKKDPTFCCLQETHLREKDRYYVRMKGWKTIFQANGLKKQAGVTILISNKIDFQPKVIKKDKKRHFILILILHTSYFILICILHTHTHTSYFILHTSYSS